MSSGKEAELLELGYFDPELHPVKDSARVKLATSPPGLRSCKTSRWETPLPWRMIQPPSRCQVTVRQIDGVCRALSGRW